MNPSRRDTAPTAGVRAADDYAARLQTFLGEVPGTAADPLEEQLRWQQAAAGCRTAATTVADVALPSLADFLGER